MRKLGIMKKFGIIVELSITICLSACSKSSGNEPKVNVDPEVTVDPEVKVNPQITVDPQVTVDPNITAIPTIVPAENEEIQLRITEIDDGYFMATDYFPSPATYKVIGDLSKDYCVDDYINVTYDSMKTTGDDTYELTALSMEASNYEPDPDVEMKPVIYLYPEKTEKVHVDIDYKGELLVTEPLYKDGWTVTAQPDGKLTDESGNTYPYLFWEGKYNVDYDMSKGFCVAGDQTKEFLDEKLALMGMNGKEIKNFEEFWVPCMQKNPYNLITFQTTQYTDHAKLNVNPKPDSELRVFMVFQPLTEYKEVEEQELSSFQRTGFTVVEWGGKYTNQK